MRNGGDVSHCNLRLCVGGGRRSNGQSAAGMALHMVGDEFEHRMLRWFGCSLGEIESAVLSWALAVEFALNQLCTVVQL